PESNTVLTPAANVLAAAALAGTSPAVQKPKLNCSPWPRLPTNTTRFTPLGIDTVLAPTCCIWSYPLHRVHQARHATTPESSPRGGRVQGRSYCESHALQGVCGQMTKRPSRSLQYARCLPECLTTFSTVSSRCAEPPREVLVPSPSALHGRTPHASGSAFVDTYESRFMAVLHGYGLSPSSLRSVTRLSSARCARTHWTGEPPPSSARTTRPRGHYTRGLIAGGQPLRLPMLHVPSGGLVQLRLAVRPAPLDVDSRIRFYSGDWCRRPGSDLGDHRHRTQAYGRVQIGEEAADLVRQGVEDRGGQLVAREGPSRQREVHTASPGAPWQTCAQSEDQGALDGQRGLRARPGVAGEVHLALVGRVRP